MSYVVRTQKTWHQTQQELAETFQKWGVSEWETNYPRGARSEAWMQQELDRTVTLTYVKGGKTINLQMGKQNRAVDNLRVLYLAVEDMRMNEKRGIAEVLQSAYAQLEAPKQQKSPWEVLSIFPGSPLEIAEAAYKVRAKEVHPDRGGSIESMTEVNEAIKAIREGKV